METAKKEKEKDIDYNKSSAQKLKGIRRNRAVEKEIIRENERFNFREADEKEHNTPPSNMCLIRIK